jgi:hypothetical protein
MYRALKITGQFFLPTFSVCTLKFLLDIMQGKKKAFTNDQIKYIEVPWFKELSVDRIFEMAYASENAK